MYVNDNNNDNNNNNNNILIIDEFMLKIDRKLSLGSILIDLNMTCKKDAVNYIYLMIPVGFISGTHINK
jgi:hypothetical protein